ncbi:MAG: C4-dicarboxylate ABC transporter [Rhodospirillales bacterium]
MADETGDHESIYSAIINGEIDAAIIDPGEGVELSTAFDLFGSAPFGPRPRELMAWLYAGGGNALLSDIHAQHGLFAMPCAITATAAAGWFRESVGSVDDVRGLRMRIQGLAAEAARKVGIEAVDLRDEQLVAAFRTGHLDAAEVSLPSVDRKLSLHEGATHYLFPGWHEPATLMVLLTRIGDWQSLTEARKRQIEMACGDNVRHGIAETEAAQFDALKDLAGLGVEVGRLPDDVVHAFSAAWLTVAEEQAEQDETFAAVWQSLSAFREDYAIWNEISSF